MKKKELSERDIISKFVLPALTRPSAGWDLREQIFEEYTLTADRITTKGQPGQMRIPGTGKRADIVLFYKPNLPLAVIEVKDNSHAIGAGMQQALAYASLLDAPFAYSSNGDAFVESDRSNPAKTTEREIPLDAFPSPAELWQRYCQTHDITPEREAIVAQDWFRGTEDKQPRHYQIKAVNRTVEAIAKGQSRILLVMATGTGKTFTAFQIIWRLWKAKAKKRVLFLADRNILVDQAYRNDFQPFGNIKNITKIRHRQVDKSYEVYLALYQAVSGTEEEKNIYKQFTREFFDLIIVDECHRGSAADDSAWREILEYFSSATQIGLTATPKETSTVSNIDYFGEPIFTYSLREGIEDGYLAPYKVIRVEFDKDVDGYTPGKGKLDKYGRLVEDRTYTRSDFDRRLVLEKRTELVAKRVTEYLKLTDRFAKTIVFCQDTEHASRMRSALVNENADLVAENDRYVRRITSDDPEGKLEIDDFIQPKERYPVIATTAQLLSTGVDVQTCKLIVIDREIGSMTEFKQIIGRGTRVREDYGKFWFTIMDFRGATRHFEDETFDGPPEQVYEVKEGESIAPPERTGEPSPGESPSVSRSGQRRDKYVIPDEEVLTVAETVVRYNAAGKRVELPIAEHTRRVLREMCGPRRTFRDRWLDPERRSELLGHLEREGASLGELAKHCGDGYATYDLLSHVGYDMPLVTRKDRAQKPVIQTYFATQSPLRRKVLEGLLAKFVDEGVETLDDTTHLTLKPLDKLGTPVELVKAFGGRVGFEKAISVLEAYLYDDA
ncbi:MAG: DEAD/DEAH box helicase family protein [Polyangiaceae bacterium]|nr:DEAD/DEAH box helicase family protein [Polyangiaceae bacterium]